MVCTRVYVYVFGSMCMFSSVFGRVRSEVYGPVYDQQGMDLSLISSVWTFVWSVIRSVWTCLWSVVYGRVYDQWCVGVCLISVVWTFVWSADFGHVYNQICVDVCMISCVWKVVCWMVRGCVFWFSAVSAFVWSVACAYGYQWCVDVFD